MYMNVYSGEGWASKFAETLCACSQCQSEVLCSQGQSVTGAAMGHNGENKSSKLHGKISILN